MEAGVDFKSLRAKFQESNQLKERPVVLDKPKRLPPIPSRTNSLSSSAMQEKNPVIPPLNLRDDQKVLSGKHPVAVPSPLFPPEVNSTGNGAARRSLKDRHMPLVLPGPSSSSSNNPRQETTASSKLVTSPIKCKKVMPTPFKPAKFAKSIKEILENAEHPESSKPQSVENGFGNRSGGSNPGLSCPSPELPSTPSPTTEEPSNGGSIPYVLSTLERAKKKFSPKNLLVYARPKSFYSSKGLTESPSPPVEYENLQCDAEFSSLRSGYRPANSPAFTAQNLPQVSSINQRPGSVSHLNGDMKPVQSGVCVPALIKVLPDMTLLGPLLKKPPRPPSVDLSAYRTHKLEATTEKASMKLARGSSSVPPETVVAANIAMPPPLQFDAPQFVDFASSVLDELNTNLAALEMEATEIGVPPPEPEEASDGNLHNDVIQKYATEPTDGNLQGPSLGHVADSQSVMPLEALRSEAVTTEISMNCPQNAFANSCISSELLSEPSINQKDDHYEVCDNIYEEVESISKFNFGQNYRKRKGTPKNPYAELLGEEMRKSVWHVAQWMNVTLEPSGVTPVRWDRKERLSPDQHDEKEVRKREKQRLEREKKEQKEKEKKEMEMKKKFKITGQEEPMYHARVLLASKLRKHDLQVKSGDTVSIIRTTNCPKGKWLARDSQNKYGYISVMNVELNMKEMLELGKRAGKGHGEADTLSLSSRSSHYNPVLTSSFTDDSEEWSGDEETLSQYTENVCPYGAVAMPNMFEAVASNHDAPSTSGMEEIPSEMNHEALQKLAVFFQNNKEEPSTVTEITEPISTNANSPSFPDDEEPLYVEEDRVSLTDVELLPPPELYADSV